MKLEQYEKEHLALVEETAAECTLFLKTDGSFPLAEAGQIAAFGSGVRHTVKGGTGSGEVNSRFSVNIEQGLVDAGFTITSGKWLEGYEEVLSKAKAQFVKDLKAEAKAKHENAIFYSMGKSMPEPNYNLPIAGEGNVAIYVVSRNSGEGTDRTATEGDILLTATEIREINAINNAYEKFMLVLNVGGVVDIAPVSHVKNILVLSQLGVVTGTVLANILLGKANPSGKLATTWAKWDDYSTIGDFGDKEDTYYKEGVYVGYRYFEAEDITPSFPFGFGKSYSEFDLSVKNVSLEGTKVVVETVVTNKAGLAGKEAVQVYLSAPEGELDKPVKDLAAIAKSAKIAEGESDTVKAVFDIKDMASYSTKDEAYILEAGNYIVRVGNSSDNTVVAAVIALDEKAVVLKAKPVLGVCGFEDYKPQKRAAGTIPADAKVLAIKAFDITTESVNYVQDYPIDDIVKSFSDEELAYVLVGGFDPKGGPLAVIGNAARSVAGAAGETTNELEEKGIKHLVMADGPAGLRLSKEFYRDEKGAHAVGGATIPESLLDYMGGFTKFALKVFAGGGKAPKKATVIEQYATAIPIGTAIAQCFNYDLAKAYGDMVGSEMERFGVHLWLAPALNIHRDIRCGRNFEYYSEDPLISGLMAAAITEGVQKHEGCGTTIKHYAANNQETNRYANNGHVSERAMREIYLKGFGICVKKAQPLAVMTSYNLLNGCHTSENRGLIEDILRCEYGFKGIVMTDWVIDWMVGKDSKYDTAYAHKVAKAGGDLFMPGCKGDYDKVLSALKSGELSRAQAEVNVTRVVRMCEKGTF